MQGRVVIKPCIVTFLRVALEQMKNPEMRKMMNNMMKNITPDQMKSMAGMGGMKMSDQQAEAMAKQMQGMKEEDLEKMMKVYLVIVIGVLCVEESLQGLMFVHKTVTPHDPAYHAR